MYTHEVLETLIYHICRTSPKFIIENVSLYTSQTLISTTINSFIVLNALNLPRWHSISFDVFVQIQQNFQWSLKMQWAILFYGSQSLDSPMDAHLSKMQIIVFAEKCIMILNGDFVSRT